MDTTYNVKIWSIRVYRGKHKTSYSVRWALDGREWRAPFDTRALADAFRSELVSATRRGEAFSLTTGRPVSHQSGASAVSWYDFAVQFADAQWHRTAGNSRKNTAKALMATTVALLRTPPAAFKPVDVRTALREFAFNTRRREEAPPQVAMILNWVERNTLSMAAWEQPVKVDEVLRALGAKLDGTRAAASSVKRNRRILNVAMEYAVKHRILRANPLPKGRGSVPKTSSAIDKRSLLNPEQAARLLGWVRRRPRGGKRLHAFFATLYYAGPRPEEAVAIDVADVRLPEEGAEDQWCELLFHTAQPEVGKNWTDDGEIHEERGLKGRAADDTRVVPGHPSLTKILREHIKTKNLKPGDLLFQGERGEMLAGSVIRRAWRSARKEVLTPEEFATPLGKRVYDLRHTCLTRWLNDGIPAAQVAEWAGNSVPVLLAIYARCVSGQLRDLKRRMEAGGDLPELPETT
ncbi:tyrosine-type recombinase/integrase [Streptomyces himalayensis]|uniref:Tyrosine-type recombinase/integrase n=1 Tax=Streptomyces himalayensis subsp. himalayensis TaxID=2756131 RepID=A0A7W0ICN0_9ACTN|nr:tyrosine-type recombinase/integrase [Streptomyces himalayensis]MBA2950329.1 tyrosine-type recombinase/integrase [Streptomyces himalayensis subsp. himalayensis]